MVRGYREAFGERLSAVVRTDRGRCTAEQHYIKLTSTLKIKKTWSRWRQRVKHLRRFKLTHGGALEEARTDRKFDVSYLSKSVLARIVLPVYANGSKRGLLLEFKIVSVVATGLIANAPDILMNDLTT